MHSQLFIIYMPRRASGGYNIIEYLIDIGQIEDLNV